MEQTVGSTSSTEGAPRAASAAAVVALGRVLGAHGLRGQLRVGVFGADPTNLMRASRVRLSRDEDDANAREYEVESVTLGRKSELRMALVGVADRDAAEALCGCIVLGRAAELAPLAPGEYYEYELVGCRVEDLDGRPIGVVREIWETGAPAVLVVEAEGGAERLIPAADGILQEVDVEARRIRIDAIPGLLDPD
jgi:16S rRNA processing protein RimM